MHNIIKLGVVPCHSSKSGFAIRGNAGHKLNENNEDDHELNTSV